MPIMYRAPETLLWIQWSYAVDIWSVGLTVSPTSYRPSPALFLFLSFFFFPISCSLLPLGMGPSGGEDIVQCQKRRRRLFRRRSSLGTHSRPGSTTPRTLGPPP